MGETVKVKVEEALVKMMELIGTVPDTELKEKMDFTFRSLCTAWAHDCEKEVRDTVAMELKKKEDEYNERLEAKEIIIVDKVNKMKQQYEEKLNEKDKLIEELDTKLVVGETDWKLAKFYGKGETALVLKIGELEAQIRSLQGMANDNLELTKKVSELEDKGVASKEVLEAYKRQGLNNTQIAEALGMSRTTLIRKLKQFGL